MRTQFFGILMVMGLQAVVQAAVEVPHLFDSHMVLPRDTEIPIWGKAAPGERVTVAFAGESCATTADASGAWSVRLSPCPASTEGRELSIRGADSECVFSDVVVGDVWLCSGQSNMEYTMGWKPYDVEKFQAESSSFPSIRFLRVGRRQAEFPSSGWAYEKTFSPTGWKRATDAFERVTSAGYFFARRVVLETGIPIGLIDASWSGSRIEPFMPAEAFRGEPALEARSRAIDACLPHTAVGRLAFDAYRADFAAWKAEAKEALAAGRAIPRAIPEYPSLLSTGETTQYNAMIHPLLRFPIKGILWYQGCANADDRAAYLTLYTALVQSWRAAWKRPTLPIYCVQLASFWANWSECKDVAGGDGFTLLREAQLKSMTLPHTGMAVTIDIGDSWEIHPKEKLHVGERLARWALAHDYGRTELVCSGPLYRAAKQEPGQIRLQFDCVGSGLMVGQKSPLDNLDPVEAPAGTPLAGFVIAGEDRIWHWAEAQIEDDEIVVHSPEVPQPVAVRYAFRGSPLGFGGCNLYNRDGLPASPFRTDSWE